MMTAPATPTKRLLTEEAHNALNAPRFPRDGIISEDLTARLQNLGTRVRKSVNEGYSTHRFGVFPSGAPTPFSSPEKASAATFSSQASPIFRSANDTLFDVFSSPVRATTVVSTLPTPRKRGRSEADSQEGIDGCSRRGVDGVVGDDLDMGELDSTSDDDIAIITDGSPRHNRPVRPLKKSARTYRPPAPSFNVNVTPQSVQPYFSSADTGPLIHATVASSEWKGMVNQPF